MNPSPSPVLYKQTALIDTSAAIAIWDKRETHHEAARQYFSDNRSICWASINITTHESYTRVRYRTDFPSAAKVYGFLRDKPVNLISFQEHDESGAMELLEKYKDQKLSYHDALCAAVMLRMGIYRIFTFDKDFAILGFEMLPGY